jgi:hypothetical protein
MAKARNWQKVAAENLVRRHGSEQMEAIPSPPPRVPRAPRNVPNHAEPKIKPRMAYPVIVQRTDLFADLAGAPRPE